MDLETLTSTERREALQAYLDGELPAPDARAVGVWLADHPEARAEVERLRRLNDLLGAYEDEPVSEGFTARVLDAVGFDPAAASLGVAPRPPLLRWRPLAAAAVLLVAVGVGGTLLLQRSRAPAPGAQTALALESVPADLLEHADVLLSLTDAEFDAVLALDPADLPDAASGG